MNHRVGQCWNMSSQRLPGIQSNKTIFVWWIPLNSIQLVTEQNSLKSTFKLGKSSIFTLKLSQKSDFQPSTTKPNNISHPTIKTRQIWPLWWFRRWFCIFLKKIKSLIRSKKSKLIHFKTEKYETSIIFFLKM